MHKNLLNDWVAEHSADFKRGYGRLFLQNRDSRYLYPDDNSLDWLPSKSWRTWELLSRVPQFIYGKLRGDFEESIGLHSSSKARKEQRRQANMANRLDKLFLKKISEGALQVKASELEAP